MKAVFLADQTQAISSTRMPEGCCPEGAAQTCFHDDGLSLIEHTALSCIGGQKVVAHLLDNAMLDAKHSYSLWLSSVSGGKEVCHG
jgi:hypothetical protein